MTDVVVTGVGSSALGCDARPYLRVRKMRKYMAIQDTLAVVAAGRALDSAGLERPLGARAEETGLYLAVGYLPFLQSDIDRLLDDSTEDGAFSMPAFATGGYEAVNPLITFRCLSNMPAFHISSNFDVQGAYVTSYPGAGQLYLALEEAVAALREGRVDVALVGGVAHQDNFLVRHHFSRVTPPVAPELLGDAAGVLVLETSVRAAERGATARAWLSELELSYRPTHPFEEHLVPREEFSGLDDPLTQELGPAALPVAMGRFTAGSTATLEHTLASRDGFMVRSAWGRQP